MTDQIERRVTGPVGEMLKRGLLAAFDQEIDTEPREDESRLGRFTRWLGDKTRGAFQEGLVDALEAEEVQEQGTEYVAQTVEETVAGVKENFSSALTTVEESLRPAEEDTRNTYQKMKDLLKAEQGSWYAKLAKKALARACSLAFPVLGYISATVAGRFTEKEEDVPAYRQSFEKIYDHLASRATV